MDLPRVNSVGITEHPEGFEAAPRRFSPSQRAFAWVLLLFFLAVTVVTSTVSLGRYCLTTDAADTRALPAGLQSDGSVFR
jgi:hypothetical protein